MNILDKECTDRSGNYTSREIALMSEINTLKISLKLAHDQINEQWRSRQKVVELKRVIKELYNITQENHYGDASIAYSDMKELLYKNLHLLEDD